MIAQSGVGRAGGSSGRSSSESARNQAQLPPGSHYDAYWSESWSHRRLWWALLVSTCLHAAAICLVPEARYKPKIIEFPPLYEVQLVKVEPERPAPPKAEVKKPVEQPKKEAPKVVTPKVAPKKEKQPEKKPEQKKPQQVEKPVEPKPEEVKPAKVPAPVAKVEAKARIEADIPRWYYEIVEDTVHRHWDEPLMGGGDTLRTIIGFGITRAGDVTGARIERESGDRRWDLAGLRAVTESRFPPLPQEYKEATLTVHFAFTHEWETGD